MTLSSDKQGEAQCPDCGGSIAEHQYIGPTGPDWKCVEPPPKPPKGKEWPSKEEK